MLRLFVILAIVLGLNANASAWARDPGIVVQSTDKNHVDADTVHLERNGKNATVVVTRNRGIGSASVQIPRRWKGRVRVMFRNFSSLEHFEATNGISCVEGSLKAGSAMPRALILRPCEVGALQPRDVSYFGTKVSRTDVFVEFPQRWLRSKLSTSLRFSWIDAYRN